MKETWNQPIRTTHGTKMVAVGGRYDPFDRLDMVWVRHPVDGYLIDVLVADCVTEYMHNGKTPVFYDFLPKQDDKPAPTKRPRVEVDVDEPEPQPIKRKPKITYE